MLNVLPFGTDPAKKQERASLLANLLESRYLWIALVLIVAAVMRERWFLLVLVLPIAEDVTSLIWRCYTHINVVVTEETKDAGAVNIGDLP